MGEGLEGGRKLVALDRLLFVAFGPRLMNGRITVA